MSNSTLNILLLWEEAGGVTWNWGNCFQTIINFLLVVIVLFFLVHAYFKVFKDEKVNQKNCTYCFQKVSP